MTARLFLTRISALRRGQSAHGLHDSHETTQINFDDDDDEEEDTEMRRFLDSVGGSEGVERKSRSRGASNSEEDEDVDPVGRYDPPAEP